MTQSSPHVTVCICTYQRPQLLKKLLQNLTTQETGGEFTFSIVVVDNDAGQSARPVVEEYAAATDRAVLYLTESRRSISHARNKSLEPATGDYVAFIDDDEYPCKDWLRLLLKACRDFNASGILGPVRAYFDDRAPRWVRDGGFYDRPEHPTGFVMPWSECRTGNTLLKRAIFSGINPVFSPEFGSGGSDVDFFKRMSQKGHQFFWCNEAVVYEIVPPNRWDRGKLLKRALLRGKNAARHPENRRVPSLLKSMTAVLLYALALPFLQIRGHHLFMKYLVKWCDHAGKLLAVVGLNPIKERAM